MITFFIEALILCLIFTILILFNSKDPINDINNYPPKIIKRCQDLKLITKD